MKNMGNTVKWSRKTNNPDPKRDITKYCEFHGDHGHSTPDCILLRFEVADLFKRGHLQDLLSDKGRTHSPSARRVLCKNVCAFKCKYTLSNK